MKKIYQNPKTRIIEIKMKPLMENISVAVSNNNYNSESGKILSRRGGDWGDDEE